MKDYINDVCPKPDIDYPLNIKYQKTPYFLEICNLVNPVEILEIGSYMGGSAIEWQISSISKKNKAGAKVYCLDTWLGSIEHYLSTVGKYWSIKSLSIDEKGPTIFDQFLSNVYKSSLEKKIIPLRGDSKAVLPYLGKIKKKFDIIYIDGAHDPFSVFQDVFNSLSLITQQGLICGDDFSSNYVKDGVLMAFLRSRKKIRNVYKGLNDNKFIILTKESKLNEKDIIALKYEKFGLKRYLLKRFFHYLKKFLNT